MKAKETALTAMELRRNFSSTQTHKVSFPFLGKPRKFPRECAASPLAASGGLKKLTEPKKLAWKEKGKSAPLVVFSFFSSLPFPSNSAVEKGRRKEEGSGSGQRGKGKKGGGIEMSNAQAKKKKGKKKNLQELINLHPFSFVNFFFFFFSSARTSVCQTIKSFSFFLLQTSKSWRRRRRNWEVCWS